MAYPLPEHRLRELPHVCAAAVIHAAVADIDLEVAVDDDAHNILEACMAMSESQLDHPPAYKGRAIAGGNLSLGEPYQFSLFSSTM